MKLFARTDERFLIIEIFISDQTIGSFLQTRKRPKVSGYTFSRFKKALGLRSGKRLSSRSIVLCL